MCLHAIFSIHTQVHIDVFLRNYFYKNISLSLK